MKRVVLSVQRQSACLINNGAANPYARPSLRFSTTSTARDGRRRVDISGVYPPITTPFTAAGQIDYGRLQENMATWNKIDFAGYVVMGSNGEAVSLAHSEKLELIRNVRRLSRPSSTIIAGLGLPTTQETIDICNAVAAEGSADAGLIISPSFYKGQMNDRVLRRFYETVADQSALPVVLYSVPANTSVDLSSDLVAALAEHPNIIGLKDSGGDIMKISEILSRTPDDFQVLAGSAGFMLPAMLMGCVGVIGALANVLGEPVVQLYKLWQGRQLEEAVRLQRSLIQPNSLVTRKLGVAGLKCAMDAAEGLYGGPCRAPLLPPSDAEREALLRAFASNGYKLK